MRAQAEMSIPRDMQMQSIFALILLSVAYKFAFFALILLCAL